MVNGQQYSHSPIPRLKHLFTQSCFGAGLIMINNKYWLSIVQDMQMVDVGTILSLT